MQHSYKRSLEMSTRKMAVAGQFYPAQAEEIRSMFSQYNDLLVKHADKMNHPSTPPRAIIVPHAGYIYSGFTANAAFHLLQNSDISRVVVIGPSHRAYLSGISVSKYDTYETPLGSLQVERALVDELITRFHLSFYPEAHFEHSTEVQMPFVKTYLKNASVVELVYGDEDPNHLAKIIDFLLQDPQTLVVISTDLSHYHEITRANSLDSICLDAVSTLDTSKLHEGCEACGKIGVEAVMIVAKMQGLKPTLLDYRTSADASGDRSQVVGYMSAAFTQE
jgi:MEMO1 family protein